MNQPSNSDSQKTGKHGIYDLSSFHLSQHALERFQERFSVLTSNPNQSAITQTAQSTEPIVEKFSVSQLIEALKSCRKLGTNPDTGAAAYLSILGSTPIIIMVSQQTVTTLLTQDQFQTVMSDFGRNRWPRKFQRWLKRIKN